MNKIFVKTKNVKAFISLVSNLQKTQKNISDMSDIDVHYFNGLFSFSLSLSVQ